MSLIHIPNRDTAHSETVNNILHAVVMVMVAAFSLVAMLRSMNIV